MKHTWLILGLSLAVFLILGTAIYQVGCFPKVQCKPEWEREGFDFAREFAHRFLEDKHNFSSLCSRGDVRSAIDSQRNDFSVDCSSGTSTARLVLFGDRRETNLRAICVDSRTLKPIYIFQEFVAPDTNDCLPARF
ncbi:MAG: hypothetical protein RJB39_237 [Candidatus Parcubacteria bacterium]|jgi:hypothetical protein